MGRHKTLKCRGAGPRELQRETMERNTTFFFNPILARFKDKGVLQPGKIKLDYYFDHFYTETAFSVY